MKRPEQELQKAVMQHLKVVAPHVLALHIPNGGKRSPIEGRIFKSLGVMAGAPDILLLWAQGKCAFIELKAGTKKNRLQPSQEAFGLRCFDLGIPWAVATSVNEVVDYLRAWGAPVRAGA